MYLTPTEQIFTVLSFIIFAAVVGALLIGLFRDLDK